MEGKSKIIVVTGAESTGKSTLSNALSDYYTAPVVPEYARNYIENLDREYRYEDVELIALKQVETLNKLITEAPPIVILDTWLLITKIWFEVVYNKIPHWLEANIKSTKIDLVLVCDIDLPWVPDNVRENGGNKRQMLQNLYLDEIKKYKFDYNIVSGQNEVRINNAIKFIANLK